MYQKERKKADKRFNSNRGTRRVEKYHYPSTWQPTSAVKQSSGWQVTELWVGW